MKQNLQQQLVSFLQTFVIYVHKQSEVTWEAEVFS